MAAAIRACVVGLGGVVLAWLWFEGYTWSVAFLLGLLALAGVLPFVASRAVLPKHPVEAERWMSYLVLAPTAVALAAAAAAIVLGAGLEPPDTWTMEQKKLVAALAAALTGVLTPLLAGGKEDEGLPGWTAARIQAVFQKVYDSKTGQIRFPHNSEAEQAVFSDPWRGQSGWGPSARRARARVIQEAIASGRYTVSDLT